MKLGIIIPAYNAASTLRAVHRRIPRALDAALAGIWIVNDGSRDGTAGVARALAAEDPRVTLLDLPLNRGYGGAMKEGLAAARAAAVDVAACIHADGQYAPEELPRLLTALAARSLDLLQGSRIAPGGALRGGMPLYKYLAGRLLTSLENRALGLRMTDYHSGYLLYGPGALAGIPFAPLSDSFDFDVEVIASARARGLAVGEEPIPTRYGGETSYLNPITYGLRVLRVVARYRLGRYDLSRVEKP